MTSQRGSLMIEVMISSLIGTLLLYGALTIMLNSKVTYLTRDGLSRVEEKGRLALEMLSEDIRMAGYKGCVSSGVQDLISAVDFGADWMQPELGIRGWSSDGTTFKSQLTIYDLTEANFDTSNWVPHDPADKGTGIDILENSDVIELWVAQPYVMDITGTEPPVGNRVTEFRAEEATMNGFVSNGEDNLLVVSDCSRNILVKADDAKIVSNVGEVILSTDTNEQSLQLESMSQPQAIMLKGVMYYLAVPSSRDRPSLYRKEINPDSTYKNAVEVLPGVLNLQFLYGENTDTEPSANRYVEADDVDDWAKVVSVRVFLLIETEENNAVPEGTGFHFFGLDYGSQGADDKRIRRQYTTTVTLRNRSLGLTLIGTTP